MNLSIPDEIWLLFRQQCGEEYATSMNLFVTMMVNRMIVSSYKYGPVTPDVWTTRRDFWATMDLRGAKARETQNTEFLIDMANFCAMAFCYPPGGYQYQPTDSEASPGYVTPAGQTKAQHGQQEPEDQEYVSWWKTRQSTRQDQAT